MDKTLRLNDVVDKIYLLNLERRPDRLQHALTQLSLNDIEAEVFSAVDGRLNDMYPNLNRGASGCLQSHLSIIKKSLYEGLESIAIIEDDAFFVEDFEIKFSNFISQVPNDWQFVYLANNKNNARVERISDNVEKVSNAWSTHAFMINKNAMETTLIISSGGEKPIDVYYGMMQVHFPAYSAVPSLAGQIASHSDIENFYVDYNGIYGL